MSTPDALSTPETPSTPDAEHADAEHADAELSDDQLETAAGGRNPAVLYYAIKNWINS